MFKFFKKKRIYMDYAARTPVEKEVVLWMDKFYDINYSNSSALHKEGLNSKNVLNESRKSIAKNLNCGDSEIIFTSGGTESDNLAMLGIFLEAQKNGIENPHIITTKIEHPAILEICEKIKSLGGEITLVSVSEEGLVSPEEIFNSIKTNTILVSVMYANNEIGTIQPLKEISKKIKDWREKNNTQFPYFHSDACQAGLYLSLDVKKLGLDMMTLDGIKIYGPGGVGVLYKNNNIKIQPIVYGGGQENGLRSGTENIVGISGFSKSLEIAESLKEFESKRLSDIRDYGISKIIENFPNSSLNGSYQKRLPNNINICFPGLDSEFAVIKLDTLGFSVSAASACNNLSLENSSGVIKALGKESCASSSIRFTFGRETKKKDINDLVRALKTFVK